MTRPEARTADTTRIVHLIDRTDGFRFADTYAGAKELVRKYSDLYIEEEA
jgi:hypothetical protein